MIQPDSTITLRSGNRMPVIGLGTWQLTGSKATEIVSYALQLGYRLIDTSGDYANQREVGVSLQKSAIHRADIYLVTKVEEDEDTYQSTVDNLIELQLNYADLVLIHRPPPDGGIGVELWEGLLEAKADKLTKDIGVSNYSIEQMQELADRTDVLPSINQIEWSPFGHSPQMLEFAKENNIVLVAYSPLTRKDRLGDDPIEEIAEHYNKTPAQVIIRWDLQHGVVPIPKASRKAQVKENFEVFDFELSEKDMEDLDSRNEQYSALGSGSLAYVQQTCCSHRNPCPNSRVSRRP